MAPAAASAATGQGTLEEQSEREECDPALFESAGAQTAALADREEAFFRRLREAAAA